MRTGLSAWEPGTWEGSGTCLVGEMVIFGIVICYEHGKGAWAI